jgi:hypothetical protein
MPDEISGMGKTHGNASLICKKLIILYFGTRVICGFFCIKNHFKVLAQIDLNYL